MNKIIAKMEKELIRHRKDTDRDFKERGIAKLSEVDYEPETDHENCLYDAGFIGGYEFALNWLKTQVKE